MFGESVVDVDVLVVGGGITGTRAALEANEQGTSVFLVTKGLFGSGGCSMSPSLASAVGPWSPKNDSIQSHFEDMVINGKAWLCDQELVKIQAEEGSHRLLELEKWGLIWDRDEKGDIMVFPSSRIYGHAAGSDRWITINRLGSHAAGPFWTGHETLHTLKSEILRRDIDFQQETILTGIQVDNGQISSATAFDYANGIFITYKTNTVILATGCGAQMFYPHTMISKENTGDGFAVAYNAGAELINIEQFEYICPHYAYPDSWRAKAVCESAVEPGGFVEFYNSKGERFMKKYDTEKLEDAATEVVGTAMYTEVNEGRGGDHGGVFISLRNIPNSTIKKALPHRLQFAEKLGYNSQKDLIEIFPVIHTMTGGLHINERCETNVLGLYAAGQVAFAVGDCLGEGATGITDSLVWGKRAGEYAAKYSLRRDRIDLNNDKISTEKNRVFAPINRQEGISPITVMRKIQYAMWKYLGLVKNEEGMSKAKEILYQVRTNELPKLYIKVKTNRGNFEVAEALEVYNLLVSSELLTESSLFRKESRNRFVRDDYPNRDDKNWLKHIVIRKDKNEQMKIHTIPVEFPYISYRESSTKHHT